MVYIPNNRGRLDLFLTLVHLLHKIGSIQATTMERLETSVEILVELYNYFFRYFLKMRKKVHFSNFRFHNF